MGEIVTRRGDRITAWLLHANVIVVLAILIVPVTVTLLMSFDARSYLGPLPPTQFSLQWYQSFFSNSDYIDALRWSFAVTGIAVTVSTVTGMMAAVFLHKRRFYGRDALLIFLLSPFVVPHVVIGFALLMAFSAYGIGDTFLRLVLGHIFLTLPISLRMTLVGLQGLGKSVEEAALTLGARPIRAFFEVTLPLIQQSIFASAVFAASVSFGEVTMTVFLADSDVRTLPVALLAQMVSNIDLTIAAAASVLVAATIAVVLLFDRLVGIERMTGGGVFSQRRSFATTAGVRSSHV